MSSFPAKARHAFRRPVRPLRVFFAGVAAGAGSMALGLVLSLVFSATAPVVLTAHTAPASFPVLAPAAASRAVPAVSDETIRAVHVTWTVRPGDTLSAIAAVAYGSSYAWPALWWVNKHQVADPNRISTGQVLKLSAWHPVTGWLASSAMRAIAREEEPPAAARYIAHRAGTYRAAASSGGRIYSAGAAFSGHVSTAGMGSFQACVISRESGGSPQVMNSSGHYGLYQFSYSTWVGHGGPGADFGHASASEQTQVFWNTVHADGGSDWSPYDGCPF